MGGSLKKKTDFVKINSEKCVVINKTNGNPTISSVKNPASSSSLKKASLVCSALDDCYPAPLHFRPTDRLHMIRAEKDFAQPPQPCQGYV